MADSSLKYRIWFPAAACALFGWVLPLILNSGTWMVWGTVVSLPAYFGLVAHSQAQLLGRLQKLEQSHHKGQVAQHKRFADEVRQSTAWPEP